MPKFYFGFCAIFIVLLTEIFLIYINHLMYMSYTSKT